jgi:NADPH2:quinone reductase
MKTQAISVAQTGGPDVLTLGPCELKAPGPHEVQLQHTAIGLNFIDVYHRIGLYPVPLPFTPGQEAAGVVTAVGSQVTDLAVGQRVAYVGVLGAYAERRTITASSLIPLPAFVSDVQAASMMLKGMTAEFLLRRCHQLTAKDTIVFHAAAGGVGQLAIAWARHLGATVIGVVGSPEKAALAQAAGAQHVLLQRDDWVAQVKALTHGRGAQVVYDSVGKDTVVASLSALAPRGLLVSFGQSSGVPPAIELSSLGGARSLFVTRPSLFAYTATPEERLASAMALFEVVRSGAVKVGAPRTFALKDVALAHRALEARETTGSVVLLP